MSTAAPSPAQTPSEGPYVLEGSRVHRLFSVHVGDTFVVAVAPPLGPVADAGPLPVVLMADADLAFGAVAQVARLMQLRRELPPFLLVGVGYGGLEPALATRGRDLTPTPAPGWPACATDAGCGGAEAFLAFLEEELLPFVASRHPVTADRSWVGSSLGGLFGAWALLDGSELFCRYVLGSPAVAFGDHAVLRAAGGAGEPRTAVVFVGVGGAEGAFVDDARRLVSVLRDREAAAATVLEVFEGEGHMSVQPMVVARGLRTVFATAPPGACGGG